MFASALRLGIFFQNWIFQYEIDEDLWTKYVREPKLIRTKPWIRFLSCYTELEQSWGAYIGMVLALSDSKTKYRLIRLFPESLHSIQMLSTESDVNASKLDPSSEIVCWTEEAIRPFRPHTPQKLNKPTKLPAIIHCALALKKRKTLKKILEKFQASPCEMRENSAEKLQVASGGGAQLWNGHH